MKILKSEEFINEAMLGLTKSVTEYLSLDSIITDVKWDGKIWNDYERDLKEPVFSEYAGLPENKGKTLEVRLDFNFEQLDKEGEYVDDVATVKTLTTVHFTDMPSGDWEIECRQCTGMNEILEFVKDNDYKNGTPGEIRDLIKDTWDEEEISYQLHNEIDYAIHWGGIEDIEGKIKDAVIEKMIEEYSKANS